MKSTLIYFVIALLISIIIILFGHLNSLLEIVGAVFLALLFIFPFWISTKVAQFTYKNMRKKIVSADRGYYGELLSSYSPSMLSFLFRWDVNKAIVSDLLNLIRKGNVKATDDGVCIVNRRNLMKTEKYIVENIKDGKIQFDSEDYYRLVSSELENSGLIKVKEDDKRSINYKVLVFIEIILVIINIVLVMTGFGVFSDYDNMAMVVVSLIMFIGLFIPIFVFIMYYFVFGNMKSLVNFNHSVLGHEIYNNLVGLRNYLSNYDIAVDENTKLLNEYYIYSVLLDLDYETVERYKKFIKD